MKLPEARGHLATERANEATADLDLLPLGEAFDRLQAEDEACARAVAAVRDELVRAVELVAARLARGGRLLYVGAGTSGRLGVLDAAECGPTFQCPPGMVQGLIAGGAAALVGAVEGVEDSRAAGRAAVDEAGTGPEDAVLGISAGGTTPFVHAALARARERGAATLFLACVPRSEVADEADVSIRVPTGPEVLAGSTRLKAGTATKLVLNRLSTLVMVRLGKTYGNLMVDLAAGANEKLWDRALRILEALTGLAREEAHALLQRAGGRVKVAAVMHRLDLGAEAAGTRLAECGGRLREVLRAPLRPRA